MHKLTTIIVLIYTNFLFLQKKKTTRNICHNSCQNIIKQNYNVRTHRLFKFQNEIQNYTCTIDCAHLISHVFIFLRLPIYCRLIYYQKMLILWVWLPWLDKKTVKSIYYFACCFLIGLKKKKKQIFAQLLSRYSNPTVAAAAAAIAHLSNWSLCSSHSSSFFVFFFIYSRSSFRWYRTKENEHRKHTLFLWKISG